MLGLAYRRVRLALDEGGEWPGEFERLADELRAALGDLAAGIEHVGSTAVPGLVSKPIIDIAIGLTEDADRASVGSVLRRCGWQFRGDKRLEGGFLFVMETRPGYRIAHAHAVGFGGPQWVGYLAVCDPLRSGLRPRRVCRPQTRACTEVSRRSSVVHRG